jgi:hypothetical protein
MPQSLDYSQSECKIDDTYEHTTSAFMWFKRGCTMHACLIVAIQAHVKQPNNSTNSAANTANIMNAALPPRQYVGGCSQNDLASISVVRGSWQSRGGEKDLAGIPKNVGEVLTLRSEAASLYCAPS